MCYSTNLEAGYPAGLAEPHGVAQAAQVAQVAQELRKIGAGPLQRFPQEGPGEARCTGLGLAGLSHVALGAGTAPSCLIPAWRWLRQGERSPGVRTDRGGEGVWALDWLVCI